MDKKAIQKASRAKRWVYGTKTEKWYLVDNKDRDWPYGIAQETFERIGEEKAKEMYLAPIAF